MSMVAVVGYILMAALLVLFRPLLAGLVRAAVLVVRPRLSREEKIARSQLRSLRLLQRAIDASCGPSHAAELRALAARS